jgi:hypothetical protein
MAPYEFRLLAEPHHQFDNAWTVTVWARRLRIDPDPSGWQVVYVKLIEGKDGAREFRQAWRDVLQAVRL